MCTVISQTYAWVNNLNIDLQLWKNPSGNQHTH